MTTFLSFKLFALEMVESNAGANIAKKAFAFDLTGFFAMQKQGIGPLGTETANRYITGIPLCSVSSTTKPPTPEYGRRGEATGSPKMDLAHVAEVVAAHATDAQSARTTARAVHHASHITHVRLTLLAYC